MPSPDKTDRVATKAAESGGAPPPLAELFARLGSSPTGLTGTAAAERLASHGPNRTDAAARTRLLTSILGRFRNPLVVILLGAASVSAFTRDVASFVIITVVVLLSLVLDIAQERKATNAAEKLRARVGLTARVLRDGEAAERPTVDIVPGDVVEVSAGDLIPADGRLIEARDLYVNEALLTGEPYPAEKQAAAPGQTDHAGGSLPADAVFMGSSVVSGTATILIVETGRATRLGDIAQALRKEPPPTAFAVGVRDFGMLILRVTVLLVLFVLMVNLLLHRPLLESFLFSLALAVGLTPELLPMVVSVTLAEGALRMARREVIVKRLSAIHDLGSMDVLCSDKTGTLTEAKIKLVRHVALDGTDNRTVLEMAYLNASFETGLKSPLDTAIIAADTAIIAADRVDLASWKKIDEVPFDFERRRVSVLIEKAGKRILVVKGAPEDIVALCDRYLASDGEKPLDAAARDTADRLVGAFCTDGMRVLGVAWREVAASFDHAGIADEAGLVLAGFSAFLDPPKVSARDAIASLGRLGVAVKIVTGDNEQVTRYVCREIGIPVGGVILGPELGALSDEALLARLDGTTLFCRVAPAQKSRIIAALRRRGHVVGYIGDGINDAPSLHAADVGLSVDSAVDVAKDAAAIILLRSDLGVVAEAIREGRRTFANIMKYVMMATSSNFGNMFSMAAAVLFLPFLPMLPVQILLNNLLYDLSETAIPMDRVDDAMTETPRRWDMANIRHFMLVLGPVSSLFDILTFVVLLYAFAAPAAVFQTGWFVESLASQILVIFVLRTRGNPLKSRPHRLLVLASSLAIAIALALPYLPVGQWFGFVPLPASILAALLGITAAYLVAVDIIKRWLFRRHPVV